MARKAFLLFGVYGLILGLTILAAPVKSASIPFRVKIGLAINQTEIPLTLSGSEKILDLSQATPRTIFNAGDLLLLSCNGETITLNDLPVGTGPILVLPDSDWLTWNSRKYRGEFLISVQNGKLNLVNRLSLEEYLQGVIPKEVVAGWPMAVLKAQAIAARTYTLASLQRHHENNFDLCTSEHCQVYGGASAEQIITNQAVTETAGQVITYQGKIIAAFYHAASGGYTDDPGNVWNGSIPYLKPVIDWDQNSPYSHWTKALNWVDLQGLVMGSYPQIGRLKQLLPSSYGKDGRVLRLILKGDLGEINLTGAQFRSLMGLPSSNLQQVILIYGPEPCITLWWVSNRTYPEVTVAGSDIPGLAVEIINPPWDQPDPWSWLQDKQPAQLVIRGAGWGHGVGLSQWGAKGMADVGYNERQILGHFYPGTVISTIDSLK